MQSSYPQGSKEHRLSELKSQRESSIEREMISSIKSNFLRRVLSEEKIDPKKFSGDHIVIALKILSKDERLEEVGKAFRNLSDEISKGNYNLIPRRIDTMSDKIQSHLAKYIIPRLLVDKGVNYKVDLALQLDKWPILSKVFNLLADEVYEYG